MTSVYVTWCCMDRFFEAFSGANKTTCSILTQLIFQTWISLPSYIPAIYQMVSDLPPVKGTKKNPLTKWKFPPNGVTFGYSLRIGPSPHHTVDGWNINWCRISSINSRTPSAPFRPSNRPSNPVDVTRRSWVRDLPPARQRFVLLGRLAIKAFSTGLMMWEG